MRLPKLYTLKEVRDATQVGYGSVMTAIHNNPQIRPIGRGKAVRLTEAEYRWLVDDLSRPKLRVADLYPPRPKMTSREIGARAQAGRAAMRRIREEIARRDAAMPRPRQK
jgi:hypothetical protein